MPATARPNAGIISGWSDFEGGWGASMNANLNAIDNLLMAGVVHVRAQGATGDGTTDDRAACQAAINAAAGKAVYFAAGTYAISNALTVLASGVTLVLAPGAVIKARAGFPAATAMLKFGDGSTVYSDFKVLGGKFDGNALAQRAIWCSGPNKTVLIKGVEVTATTGVGGITAADGVSIGNPALDVVVRDCYVHDVFEGILAMRANDVVYFNNRVYDMNVGASQDGLEIVEVTGFQIISNRVRNPGNSNSAIDIFENSSDGIVVANILRATTGTPAGATGTDHNTTPCKNVKFIGNMITGAFGSGISTNAGKDIDIIGNTIRDMTQANTSKGMEIKGDSVLIEGNRIERTQNVSIHIIGARDNVRIVDNDLEDPVLGGFGGNEFINVQAGVTNCVIRGNRFRSTAGAARNPQVSIVNAAGAQIMVEGNEFQGIVTGGRHIDLPNDSGLKARRNSGHVTEASGTATIVSTTTSITVNHGLSQTPALKDIQVTPTNNPTAVTRFWVSNPTSTQFTINVNADPGGTTATFAWAATII